MGVLWVLVENWALSSECFDAELYLTRMLSPSFYVVRHNTQDPLTPAQALIATQHCSSSKDTISSCSHSLYAGLIRLSILLVASRVNVDIRLINRICFREFTRGLLEHNRLALLYSFRPAQLLYFAWGYAHMLRLLKMPPGNTSVASCVAQPSQRL